MHLRYTEIKNGIVIMETSISITSLEQVPAGLTLLLKKVTDLEFKISSPTTPPQPASDVDQLRTRKETAARLSITLATLHEYTKSGRISAYRIGNRVLYKDSDIQNALRQVKVSIGGASYINHNEPCK